MATKARAKRKPQDWSRALRDLALKEAQNESLRRYVRELESEAARLREKDRAQEVRIADLRRDAQARYLLGGEVHEVRTPPGARAVSPVYMDAPTGVVAVAALRPGDRLLMVRRQERVEKSGLEPGGSCRERVPQRAGATVYEQRPDGTYERMGPYHDPRTPVGDQACCGAEAPTHAADCWLRFAHREA